MYGSDCILVKNWEVEKNVQLQTHGRTVRIYWMRTSCVWQHQNPLNCEHFLNLLFQFRTCTFKYTFWFKRDIFFTHFFGIPSDEIRIIVRMSHSKIYDYYKSGKGDKFGYCFDVENVMNYFHIKYEAKNWRLFISNAHDTMNVVLIHQTMAHSSIPMAYWNLQWHTGINGTFAAT